VARRQARQLLDPTLREAAALVYVADLESPEVTGGDAHHLLGPLRLRPGELIAVSDGKGGYRGCRLAAGAVRAGRAGAGRTGAGRTGAGRSGAGRSGAGSAGEAVLPLVLETPIQRVERAVTEVTVGISVAKGDRTEWAVAKLVEIGVDRIVPLVCERTVVRPGPGRPERLRRVAREAAMQSRRLFLPEVSDPLLLNAALGELSPSGVALAEPEGDPVSLQRPIVLIGPEGGWSPAERSLKLPRVGLGETVLRVETAAVVAGALLVAMRGGLVLPVEDVAPS
jgi:16S rRNA (uracil1498-N3)-methyltransferase